MKRSEPESVNTPAVLVERCRLRLGRVADDQVFFRLDELRIERREQVAFTGPSGCGKSTLLNLIAGMLAPGEGRVLVNGIDLASISAARRDVLRGRSIGIVHQSFNLLDGFTALENVLVGMHFGRSERRDKREHARQLLQRVGLARRMHARPASLSVGERQRVAIARAVANGPALLLADEPTGALDPVHAGAVMDLLIEMATECGCTLAMVTHDMDAAARFSRRVDCRHLISHERGMA